MSKRWATIENAQWDKTGVNAPYYVRLFLDDIELERVPVEGHPYACELYEAWIQGDFQYVLAACFSLEKDELV